MLKSCLFVWTNDFQVLPHSVAGYATAATAAGEIQRLVAIMWLKAFYCKIYHAFNFAATSTIALMSLIIVVVESIDIL